MAGMEFGDDTLSFELLEALGSSLSLPQVLDAAYPLLVRLIPADCGALGVSASNRPEDYEWLVNQLPAAFFDGYPEMAPHDFVRAAVASRPNQVLRDQDMIARAELVKNPMYHRAREVGAPLEQVMAVMLHVDGRWQSGLSLYRERRRPFSRRERAALQRLTPALGNAVRNCQTFQSLADWKGGLERVLEAHGMASILATATGREIGRSSTACQLLEKWFPPHECAGNVLPPAIRQSIASAPDPGLGRAPPPWKMQREDAILEVHLVPLPACAESARWMVNLRERRRHWELPPHWRARLTPKEQQVTTGILRGWGNRLVAEELAISELTVKRHVQNIFNKLGVSSRSALIAAGADGRD